MLVIIIAESEKPAAKRKERSLEALLKAVKDTSNVPLATVRTALTIMLIGGGSTTLKSIPDDEKM